MAVIRRERPRPLRALARIQAEMAWNRTRRESGAAGLAAAVFVILIATLALLPPVLGSALVGNALASSFGDLSSEEGLRGVTVFHAFLVWFFGVIGLVGAGRPRFTDPRFRVYPIPRRSLLAAELAASLLDFVPLLGIGCFVGFLAGIAIAEPVLALLATPVVAGGVLSLLLVYQATGAVNRILLKRPRAGLAFLGAVVLSLLGLRALAAERGLGYSLHLGLERFLALQPSNGAWLIVQQAFLREPLAPGPGAAVLPLCLALSAVAVVRLLAFEADLEPRGLRRAAHPDERLWSFGRPAAGIARLFVSQILAQGRGRFLVLAPALGLTGAAFAVRLLPPLLPELVEVHGPLRILFELSSLPVLGWFPAAAVGLSGDLWANQFGPDGHGIKTLFGLPVPTREIVLGKFLGVAELCLLQSALCLPAMLALGHSNWKTLLHAVGSGGVALVILGGLGILVSARFPHRSTGGAGEPQATPIARLVLPMLGLALLAEVLILTEWLARRIHPEAPPFAMVGMFVALLFGFRALLPELARGVDAQRERLIEELS